MRFPGGSRRFFEFPPLDGRMDGRKHILVQPHGRSGVPHYTNWLGGNETQSCDSRTRTPVAERNRLCEPVDPIGNVHVAINGGTAHGGWVNVPPGFDSCRPGAAHSVCGYYREFSIGSSFEPSSRLAVRKNVDMERFREFCLKS